MAKGWNWIVIIVVALVSTGIVWWQTGLATVRQNYDGPYYAVVAKTWYNHEAIRRQFSFTLPLQYYAAHFPMYPALMAGVSLVTNLSYIDAGLIITALGSCATSLLVYYIAKKNRWGNPLFLALAWLFFWPRIWAVRSVASPETIFIFFTLLSLWWFDLKKYWLAGLAGAAAVLTKSPGILLFASYCLLFKERGWKIYPVLLIPLALVGLFSFYYLQTGDFFAYFNSGDNIHLQVLPFRIFDSSQAWVGEFWLEDVLWVYLVGAIGTYYLYTKNKVFGTFSAVFFTTILFVSHRDISRYALPLAPLALFGFAHILNKKAVRWIMAGMIVPIFFYTVNFLSHNQVGIANWAPFFP